METPIIKLVKRGYIMRFNPEEFFEMELYPIPKGVELYSDELYYIDYGDGQPLRECYHRFSSEKFDMYQTESWEDTLKFQEEMRKQYLESLPKAPKFREKFNKVFYGRL